MKFKTTRKAIVEGYSNIVSIGYCDAANLLVNHDPVAYTCGVYGWNFDLYVVNGVAICTGYRNMAGRKANNVHEYEKRAKEIRNNWEMPYEERFAKIEELLEEFCEQA